MTHQDDGRFPKVEQDSQEDYNEVPTYPQRPSFQDFKNQLRRSSQMVVFDGAPDDVHHPSSTPLYITSTFVQPSSTEYGGYDYTRSGNPTRTALEKHVALLEGAHTAFAFTSGMSALMTVVRLLKPGDELIVGEDIYGGMARLLSKIAAPAGLVVRSVNTCDVDVLEAAITDKTKMVHMETPSNPLMKITDVRKISSMLKSHNILLSVDATMMSPYLMKPLEMGANIVIHSATKFFGGHADCMGGFVVVNDVVLANQIAFYQNAEGTALSPFDCWLFLRGVKTMAIRIEKAQENAIQVARWLDAHGSVTKVYYAGLETHEGYALHKSQSLGPGVVMSFTTGNLKLSQRFIDACRIFKLTVSFGSVNSLCEMPCTMSHASVPAKMKTLPDDLVRLSIGIEDVADLLDDLAQAFRLAESNVSDIVKFKEAEKMLFDSHFEERPVVPELPKSHDTKSHL
eukprot:m.108385 g.108385  ORF g.108385 m.108385 type:complete len:456 (+) comp27871_c1_seq1:100-1467(+)